MEDLGIIKFWKGKKVFITGHTGFKGTWLTLWLHHLGAHLSGFALAPPKGPNLYDITCAENFINSKIADIRNEACLQKTIIENEPEIIFHLAAQPLVRESYNIPSETYSTNVMGTVHLLNSVRFCPSVRSVVIITTDKCYQNQERSWGYRENDKLWGYDPYSSSKVCCEIVTSAFRDSFFNPQQYNQHGVAIATARAGNVVGGGDWGKDRLIPDCIRALLKNNTIHLRNPQSVRPWQYVLNTLSGYLLLAEQLYTNGVDLEKSWNFGPDESEAKTVEWIVKKICKLWPGNAKYNVDKGPHPHETNKLFLNSDMARQRLNWNPNFGIEIALKSIIEWTNAYQNGDNMAEKCFQQIREYEQF